LHAQITLCDPRRRAPYDLALSKHRGELTEDDAPKTDASEVEALRAGSDFAGRYHILGHPQPGGLGRVYEAMDSNLRTHVSISVIHPEFFQDKAERRQVEQAARAAATLDHPQILRVDEVGEHEGYLFLRTRFVESTTLLERIERAPAMRLPVEIVRRRMTEIATVLQYAHGRGHAHGDLRPTNVLLDGDDLLIVSDFAVARAVSDVARGGRPPPWRAPELFETTERTPAGDLFSLGCLGYQMLTGMPPYGAKRRAAMPRDLPEEVPEAMSQLITQLIQVDPAKRPANASEVIDRLRVEKVTPHERSPNGLLAAAACFLAATALLLVFSSRSNGDGGASVQLLLAEGKRADAIAMVRGRYANDPDDADLAELLGQLLLAESEKKHRAGALWEAQALAREAADLDAAHEPAHRVLRTRNESMLAAIRVVEPLIVREPVVRVRVGEVPLHSITIGGVVAEVRGGVASARLKDGEGARDVEIHIIDKARNERRFRVSLIVDTTPPKIDWRRPAADALISTPEIEVDLTVTDANPPETVRIGGRSFPLRDKIARGSVRMTDGERIFEVEAVDRAGNRTKLARRIVVDTKPPLVLLDTPRLVTREKQAVLRGRVGAGVRLEYEGRPVPIAADRSFEIEVPVETDGEIFFSAWSRTGTPLRVPVRVVVDKRPPEVRVKWRRRGEGGEILFGGAAIRRGVLSLPLAASDVTEMTFKPSVGTIEGRIWRIPIGVGKRAAGLRVRDEAGNETSLSLVLWGRAEAPRLTVELEPESPTRETRVTLRIDGEGTLVCQGRSVQPGPVVLDLQEGRHRLLVETTDAFGNVARWQRAFEVDQTPPQVSLRGRRTRGAGLQTLVFVGSEKLVTLKVAGKVHRPAGREVPVPLELRAGTRTFTVTATDQAGNESKSRIQVIVKKNGVLKLDGRSAVRVELPETYDAFTLECWVRGGGARAGVIPLVSNVDRSGFGLYWSSKGRRYLHGMIVLADRGSYVHPGATKIPQPDHWVHLALCHDGRTASLFVAGKLVSRKKAAGTILRNTKLPLYIGAEPENGVNPAFLASMEIDEVRISDVVRYDRDFEPAFDFKPDSRTRLLFHFDSYSGKRFQDHSGHGRHGTPVGAPVVESAPR